MEIKLENIGLIKDSTIRLDGLTVITGENNSGKTTVGKAIYALVEGVSDLAERAERDQVQFINMTLFQIQDDFASFFRQPYSSDILAAVLPDNPILCKLMNDWSYDRFFPNRAELENIARSLYKELTNFKIETINFNSPFFTENRWLSHKYKNPNAVRNGFQRVINETVSTLKKTLAIIEQDPQLIDYARESINKILNVEFRRCINSVFSKEKKSRIEVSDNDIMLFSFDIFGNEIIKSNKPIFFGTPYKKAFFIDNPFILDSTFSPNNQVIFLNTKRNDSNFTMDWAVTHDIKLNNQLRAPSSETVLETLISNDKLALIKQKISAVVSGHIEFNVNGDLYVSNGYKIPFSILATGSKIFSFLKTLIDKGQIDEKTLLILDEPEAHLHPEWQNKFAEIIVLLVKHLGTNILLTSHSPNFVMAIDAHMRKYEITNRTNFYQTSKLDGDFVKHVCVNEDLGRIYADFMKGYSKVKTLRDYCLDSGDCDDN